MVEMRFRAIAADIAARADAAASRVAPLDTKPPAPAAFAL